MKTVLLLFIATILLAAIPHAQTVGIGTTTPHSSAVLDVKHINKGLLVPRVVLGGTDDATTIPSPAASLVVYNLSSSIGPTAVSPGFYYWSGTEWLRFVTRSNSDVSPPVTSWLLGGNAGTIEGTHFIGTTDNVPFIIKVNNQKAGRIDFSSGNTFWGYQSGDIATGGFNTANGYQALKLTTAGTSNTANGYQALLSNTGSSNTANGYQALLSNTSGGSNTANGYQALKSNTTGNHNTAHGISALSSNTGGSFNVGIGFSALALSATGSGNTAVGFNALLSNVSGNSNTGIGNGADVSSDALTNATAIGAGAIVNASHKVRIGSTSVTVIEGQVAYSFPSDARFKYNIQTNVPGLDFITKLQPVTYYFDEEKLADYIRTGNINNSMVKKASYNNTKKLHTGFLAQDVEKTAKQLGYSFDGVHAPANDRDHYSLAYSQFIMPLVKSVQELQKQIDEKQSELDDKQKQIDGLNARLQKLEKILEHR